LHENHKLGRFDRAAKDVSRVGGIESSRYLEAIYIVSALSAIRTNNWKQAFEMLRS
jgi:hypothetical protein